MFFAHGLDVSPGIFSHFLSWGGERLGKSLFVCFMTESGLIVFFVDVLV